ncbi:fibrinogen alpha chain [Gadus macrocephalus]|uniref:fibrinogen alpha chain n=1 Tax=Gadus macrocephalus TaxID=80720 RepID=UPI0028CB3DFB|nr:fibrinogen alpha chain [Gadus macrocephalus]
MCTDEDWGSGCPSGCVVQALLLQQEVAVERRMLEVCDGVERHHHASRSTLGSSWVFYHTQRHALGSQRDSVLRYVAGADRLARKLRLLRKLSSASSQRLKELRQQVQKQMEELYHTEVDVDIKIRACQGSCASRLTFRLQEEDYPDLLDQMALSPPAPPPRRELPDVATSAPGGLEEQLRHFGDIEENKLVIHPPRLHPEHPDL